MKGLGSVSSTQGPGGSEEVCPHGCAGGRDDAMKKWYGFSSVRRWKKLKCPRCREEEQLSDRTDLVGMKGLKKACLL